MNVSLKLFHQQPTRKLTKVVGSEKEVLAAIPEFYATVHSIKNDCFTLGFSADLEKAKNIM